MCLIFWTYQPNQIARHSFSPAQKVWIDRSCFAAMKIHCGAEGSKKKESLSGRSKDGRNFRCVGFLCDVPNTVRVETHQKADYGMLGQSKLCGEGICKERSWIRNNLQRKNIDTAPRIVIFLQCRNDLPKKIDHEIRQNVVWQVTIHFEQVFCVFFWEFATM